MNPHERVTRMFEDSLVLEDIYSINQRLCLCIDELQKHVETGGISRDAYTDLWNTILALMNTAKRLEPKE